MLNHLINLYEIRSKTVKSICKQEFKKIEQSSKQFFDEFYCVFIKYLIFRDENNLMYEMKRKVNSTL